MEFCRDFYGTICQQLWRCGCSEKALERCERELEDCPHHSFFQALEQALEQRQLRYDGQAATRMLARLRDDPALCEDQFVALGFDSYSGHTFGGTFLGTLPPGAECGEADDKSRPGVSLCQEAHLCLTAADGVTRCVAAAAEGAPCPLVPSDPGSSCFEHKAADSDGNLTSAHADLSCVPATPRADMGTCRRGAPDGSACSNAAQCASGLCRSDETGTSAACAQPLSNDAECTDPAECSSGRCNFFEDPPRCAERLSDALECLIDEDCANGACRFAADAELGTCAHPEPPARLTRGAACTETSQCASGACADGACRAPICTRYAR